MFHDIPKMCSSWFKNLSRYQRSIRMILNRLFFFHIVKIMSYLWGEENISVQWHCRKRIVVNMKAVKVRLFMSSGMTNYNIRTSDFVI